MGSHRTDLGQIETGVIPLGTIYGTTNSESSV